MTETEFKQELFIKLLPRALGNGETIEETLYTVKVINDKIQGRNIIHKPRTLVDPRILEPLEDIEDIEDIREGEYSGVSLSDAVEKLAFELKNDRDFYLSYQTKLTEVMSNVFDDSIYTVSNRKIIKAAQTFLDDFIRDVEKNKENNDNI